MSTAAAPSSIPALMAPPPVRDNPLTRSVAGLIGLTFLSVMLVACLGTLPWTLGTPAVAHPGSGEVAVPRYNAGEPRAGRLPPFWAAWSFGPEEIRRANALVPPEVVARLAAAHGLSPDEAIKATEGAAAEALRDHWPRYWLGTDLLGRSLLIRALAGGGISLLIGIAAAALSVLIGTLYGAIAAYAGGRTDAVMMRIVDILYGLPYILLVVLLAVASDAALDNYISRRSERQGWIRQQAALVAAERGLPATAVEAERLLSADDDLRVRLEETAAEQFAPRNVSAAARTFYDIVVLLVAIGGVSWLTMARVVRGQVLSLKSQPFMEAARAMGVPWSGQFTRHILPNILGPIIVYATLTVPQAILQESFLSFLGIGVKPPLPSWGNLAAEGLPELNPYKSHWWMLAFPCLLLGTTLLALNFVGEGLREAADPKRGRR